MRGRPFQPGNKYGRGRPPGSRTKSRMCAKTRWTAMPRTSRRNACIWLSRATPRPCGSAWERLIPARRQRALHFNLPPVKTIADVAAASESVVRGVARGQLTPAEGQAFSVILDGRRRMIETEELDQRIRALEDLNK